MSPLRPASSPGWALRGRLGGNDEVAPTSDTDAQLDILVEEQALVDELLGGGPHGRLVDGDVGVPLLQRGTRVAPLLALRRRAWQRDARAEVVDELPGPATVRMAGVEAEVGRHGDGDVGHAHAGDLVAIGVEGRHRAGIR